MGPMGVLWRRSTWLGGGGFHKGRTDSTYRAAASNGLLRGVPPLHNKGAGILLSSSTLTSITYIIYSGAKKFIEEQKPPTAKVRGHHQSQSRKKITHKLECCVETQEKYFIEFN